MSTNPAPASADPTPAGLHVAIIMDGNGRWAQARGLPRTAGHKRGAEAVREAVEGAIELGIRHLTLFGFSSENWKRPASEVFDLMSLLRFYLRSEIASLHKNGVRVRVIGERTKLDPDIVALIENAERLTQANVRLDLIVALSYGGRADIVGAARRLAAAVKAGTIDPDGIDEALFADHLSTAGIPDPDLLIRTSGELRVSNFLLWQLAYSEFLFVDTLWPDFTRRDLAQALDAFRRRNRRYGAAGV